MMSLGKREIRMTVTLRNILRVFTILLIGSLAVTARAADKPKPDIELKVPMSDGVGLGTNVYLPNHDATGTEKFPVIMERTPYNKDATPIVGGRFFDKGYAVVSQNVRGTPVGNPKSDGEWTLYGADGWGDSGERDGVDTLEWVLKQPWCNGKVGIAGFSGSGIPALMLVAASPKGLSCCYVMATSDSMYDTIFPQGAYRKNTIESWPPAKPTHEEIWKHPAYDGYWAKRDARSRCATSTVPTYTMGGWFDLFQMNMTGFYAAQNKGETVLCKLAMAPISHAGPGAIEFKDRGDKNADKLIGSIDEWFGYWLKGEQNGIDSKPRVALFHMTTGDDAPGNQWETLDTWPPVTKPLDLFLHVDRSLSATDPGERDASASYVYDPANPMPTNGGNNLVPKAGPQDQREAEARPDQLLFATEPLQVSLTLLGAISVNLFAASDCVDTDFGAKLTDVFPDGRSMLIVDGMVRARYRDNIEKESMLEPRKIYEFKIDLGETYWTIPASHSLRLSITSSNSPRFEPNPNTGAPFKQGTEMRKATNTVYFDVNHASRLTIGTPQ
jgi:predicted acyl esterase